MPDVVERLNAALEGRYRLERELGAGGMATVYLADDLRHERKVAVKVLKPELAAVVGADRFLTEIKTTANLQHPHILPLFDSGEADSFLFYVMPYIEGETLRDRLDRERQLPVDEALGIGIAVANALQAAHEAGIVHRDIKPGNILLSRGEPLVADFGIALAVGAAGGNRLTETGLSVGTPYYMSPEQATGDQAIGAASDTYALAAVLYEMLTGDPPYTGSTAQAVLGKIIQGVPVSATAVRKTIPHHVDAAVRKALEKLPADRFTQVRDFARALGDPSFRHGDADAAAGGPGPWKRIALATSALAAVLAGVMAWSAFGPRPPEPVGRFAIPTAEGASFGGLATILPDGSGMIYVAPGPAGEAMLWIRRWDEESGTPIRGTEGARPERPGVSPDGTEVTFSAGWPGPLRVAPLLGGAVRTIADDSYGGGVWSADGSTIYYPAESDGSIGVSSVSSGGGEVTRLLFEADHVIIPFWLLDDEGVLLVRRYAALNSSGDTEVVGLELSTGEVTAIVQGTSPIAVLPGGQLVYGMTDGTLMAAPFDRKALRVTRAGALMIEGIAVNTQFHTASSVSANGSVLYQPGTTVSRMSPLWVARDGSTTVIDPDWSIVGPASDLSLSLSPDGRQLAYTSWEGGIQHVSLRNLETGTTSKLTFEGVRNGRMSWSADGEVVYFTADYQGSGDLWARPADGSRAAELLYDNPQSMLEAYVTPDGKHVVYRMGGNDASDIYTRSMSGDTTSTVLVNSGLADWQPAVAPNGRWFAYASNESGQFEVYVRPFPNAQDTRVQVSAGGWRPMWSADGSELFYVGDSGMMSASVAFEPSFRVLGTRLLFSKRFTVGTRGGRIYDVHPDGERFIAVIETDSQVTPIIYVQNWREEVEVRVGN